jgi:site-specific DNA-methyltransferase (cytosine-N4-specific)
MPFLILAHAGGSGLSFSRTRTLREPARACDLVLQQKQAANTSPMQQPDLFEPLLAAYRNVQINDEGISNTALYRELNLVGGERKPVGRARQPHNLEHRKVRWHQQTLRRLGLLERVPGQRGHWRLTPRAQKEGDLTPAPEGVALVAFSTDLGVAIWTRTETLAGKLTDQISAIITSPPYPLAQARAYGNPSEAEYVDFICRSHWSRC